MNVLVLPILVPLRTAALRYIVKNQDGTTDPTVGSADRRSTVRNRRHVPGAGRHDGVARERRDRPVPVLSERCAAS